MPVERSPGGCNPSLDPQELPSTEFHTAVCMEGGSPERNVDFISPDLSFQNQYQCTEIEETVLVELANKPRDNDEVHDDADGYVGAFSTLQDNPDIPNELAEALQSQDLFHLTQNEIYSFSETSSSSSSSVCQLSPSEQDQTPMVLSSSSDTKLSPSDSKSALPFSYHVDVTQIPDEQPGERLYAPITPGDDNQSRVVVVKCLPADVSLSQIIRSIRARGGIVRAQLLNGGRIPHLGIVAYLEFVHAEAASAVVDSAQTQGISLLGVDNATVHIATAELAASPSFPYSWMERLLFQRQQSRRLAIAPLPVCFVWSLIGIAGLPKVTSAEYDQHLNRLTLEFRSLVEADQAYHKTLSQKTAQHSVIPHADIGFISEECERHVDSGEDKPPTPHISAHCISDTFNRSPYNERTLDTSSASDFINIDTQQPIPPTQTPLQKLARYFDCDEDEVEGIESDFRLFRTSHSYRILGSSITLTRRRSGWSILLADEMKLLMLHTLHASDWREYWDDYFESRHLPNLRKYEEYSAIAEKRYQQEGNRQKASGLRSADVPDVVKKYFQDMGDTVRK